MTAWSQNENVGCTSVMPHNDLDMVIGLHACSADVHVVQIAKLQLCPVWQDGWVSVDSSEIGGLNSTDGPRLVYIGLFGGVSRESDFWYVATLSLQ